MGNEKWMMEKVKWIIEVTNVKIMSDKNG